MNRPDLLEAQERPGALPRGLVALGLVIYSLAGVLSAAYEVLFVPLRIGATIVPISVALAVATNATLPRLSRRISNSGFGAMVPFLGWLVAVFVLALGRPEGDVFLSGGSNADALVGYALMVAGFLSGLVTVLRTASLALASGRAYRRSEPGSRR